MSLDIGDEHFTAERYLSYGNLRIVSEFKGAKAIARVVVGYTSDGQKVHLEEGKLEGTIGEPAGTPNHNNIC